MHLRGCVCVISVSRIRWKSTANSFCAHHNFFNILTSNQQWREKHAAKGLWTSFGSCRCFISYQRVFQRHLDEMWNVFENQTRSRALQLEHFRCSWPGWLRTYTDTLLLIPEAEVWMPAGCCCPLPLAKLKQRELQLRKAQRGLCFATSSSLYQHAARKAWEKWDFNSKVYVQYLNT